MRVSCHQVAMELLARREHSRQELEGKLASRGFGPDDIDDALVRLEAIGALSDRRFAEMYAHQRAARGYGPVKIEYELRERGIEPSLVRLVLAEYGERWVEVARSALARHTHETGSDAQTWARLYRYLERRGFTASVIREALKEA